MIVNSSFSFKQIVSFDERNQVLTTNFFLLIGWRDPRCSWDPKKYNDVQFIVAPAEKFWIPDLAILNSALSDNIIKIAREHNVLIDHDRKVYLSIGFPSQSTRCKLNVYKYVYFKSFYLV